MEKILTNFRNTVFQKFATGEIYFKSSARNTCKLGDVAKIVKNMNPVRYDRDTVTVYDNSFGGVRYYDEPFYSNSHEFIVMSNSCDPYYIYCFLQAVDLESKMIGFAVRFLRKENLEELEILLPSLEEQRLIGKYMKLIDKKIKLERMVI